MNKLFESMYGKDKVQYKFLRGKGTSILDSDDPRLMFVYDHNTWEANYRIFQDSVDTKPSSAAKSLKPQMDLYCSLLSPHDELGPGSKPENDVNCGIVQIENSRSFPVNRGHTSVPVPSTFSSAKSATINSPSVVDLTDCSPPGTLSSEIDAWLRSISTLTRREVGNINVPQVSVTASHASHVISVFGAACNDTNPLLLHERPPERLVNEAEKALRSKEGQPCPAGVTISNLGTFSRDGIAVLRKFCDIANIRALIRTEERWLDQANSDGLSMAEIYAITEVLWNRRVTETVLQGCQKSIDVSSFSTLVEERYLDNFVIDVTISWFLKDLKGSKTIYLPSEMHSWLKTNDSHFVQQKLQEILSSATEEEFDLLLCPLHMSQSHWGIIVVDLIGKKLYFDDGYRWQPDNSVLPSMKFVLDVFQQLRPHSHCFSGSFWVSVVNFERFGMPSQRDCHKTGQGTGSCGVGVILAARDFILKGAIGAVNQFDWQYTQMRHLRKQLMIQIIKWASSV